MSTVAGEHVLGAVLLEPDCWPRVRDLQPEHFEDARHRAIFGAMLELTRRGEPIELETLATQLDGRLESVGGRAALLKLRDQTATFETVGLYVEALREAATAAAERLARPADLSPPPEGEQILLEAYAEEVRANGKDTPQPQTSKPVRQPPIAWDSLEGRKPPAREWIIPHWIPARHTTLLAGRGGIGKTLLGQHIATAVALGHDYIEPLEARRVLMWGREDDEAEFWRRQLRINSWMGQPLSALTERFYLHSYDGTDITLMAPLFGALTATPMLTELREQVGDYRAEVVILDNVARLFGGNENDRHSVTTFCALVQGACAPAAVILLGHPAKAAGSEYSGSTAWEGAVRARLYLSDRQPDQDTDDDAPIDCTRYLSRRKANYSALDIRRFTLTDGVLIPDALESARVSQPRGELAKDIVRRAVQKLAGKDIYGVASTASSNYLPKLAQQYKLLDTLNTKSFAATMRELIMAGELASREVGRTSDRHPKSGLVLP